MAGSARCDSARRKASGRPARSVSISRKPVTRATSAPKGIRPPTGNTPRFTAKTRISRMPNQKPGSDTPNSETADSARSSQESRFTAAATPSGTATATATSSATSVSSMVAGRRSAMTSKTGRRWKKEMPKSPVSALPRKIRNRVASGRSRPRSWRRLAACSAVARWSASMISTGSPGVSAIIRKTMTLTPSRTTGSWTSRSSTRDRFTRRSEPGAG